MNRGEIREALREAWPVAAAALLALALGLFELGRQSFDVDEGVSAYTATRSLTDVIDFVRRAEPNNFLYFDFLFAWEKLFSSEELLRLPSVIAYASSVPLTAAIAWRLFGRAAGVAAAFLLVLSVYALQMGQDARAYAMLMAFSSASTLCFILAIARATTLRWFLWAAASALAAYAHPFGLLVVAVQVISLAWLPPARVPWRPAGIAAGALGVAVLPLLVALLAAGNASRISWIAPATPENVRIELEVVLGSTVLVGVYAALAIALAVPALRARPRRSEETWREMLPVLWLIVPLLLAIVISLVQHMFYRRYLIVLLPGAAIVAAAVLVRLRPPALAAAAVIVLCALQFAQVVDWYGDDSKEDWRGAAEVLEPRVGPQESIFVRPFGQPALAWYLDREVARGPNSPTGTVRSIRSLGATPRAITDGLPRVWLVEVEQGGGYEPEARLAFSGRPVLEEWDLNRLRVSLLGPR